ncbi:MAG: flagellin [Brevundimonas sp.]
MANSINTNSGALIALQSLNQTGRELGVTQNRINTGLKVSSAKDNGAIFAIAAGLRAEGAALDSVKTSIQRGQGAIDVALAAGDVIVEALKEQKALAVSIASAEAGSAAETAYQADFDALTDEITSALAGANFDGVNLFEADADVITDTEGTTFSLGGSLVVVAAPTAAAADTALSDFTAKLATLGTASKSLDRQLSFTAKVQDALEIGVGNLVDADLAKESARLQALQTKQQLGVQALSIANQSSSILLGLFR